MGISNHIIPKGPYHGLHYTQWIYCIGFGIGGMIISVILKLIPDSIFGVILIYHSSNSELKSKIHLKETQYLALEDHSQGNH